MAKGIIFNIEEFAVHDGPGIRKLVFFKGCPLQCTWCHNPEGISFRKELMVSWAACINCGRCSEVCTHEVCITCGECTIVCPQGVRKINGQEFHAKELAEQLLKGKEVLINSGGGITISGGEPLAQPDFLFDLIKELKTIHIAVETSGYAQNRIFSKMVSEVDLVLMDIKHTDTKVHKRYTGVDNFQILENLAFLCQSDTDFYIRVPLIPGVNDTKENLNKTAQLVQDAKHLKRIELMPYHQTAGAKYEMVGRSFTPGFDTTKKVNTWREIFNSYNLNIKVL